MCGFDILCIFLYLLLWLRKVLFFIFCCIWWKYEKVGWVMVLKGKKRGKLEIIYCRVRVLYMMLLVFYWIWVVWSLCRVWIRWIGFFRWLWKYLIWNWNDNVFVNGLYLVVLVLVLFNWVFWFVIFFVKYIV